MAVFSAVLFTQTNARRDETRYGKVRESDFKFQQLSIAQRDLAVYAGSQRGMNSLGDSSWDPTSVRSNTVARQERGDLYGVM